MSRVTNVILHVSILEEDECEDGPIVQVVALNRVLMEECRTSFERVDQHAGGGKFFEATVFMAAFNHCPTPDIIAFVRQQQWTYPEDVQVFVKEQEDDGFALHGITEDEEEP